MNKMKTTEFVKNIITHGTMSINDWSNTLNVTRQTIYNWLKSENIHIRKYYVNRIADISNKKIIWDENNFLQIDEIGLNNKNKIDIKNDIDLDDDLTTNELNDKLQRQLQLLITKYDHAFNSSSDPMAVAVNDNYTSMNAAMEKLLGIKERRGLFGSNIYDIIAPPFRDDKKKRRKGSEAIGKFEYQTALQDIFGNEISGKLKVTRFWLPTNKYENILCSVMTFFPKHK
jgi:PAS domain-containing protein